MCRNTFRRTSLVDRNSFRAPRGGAMLLRSSSWRPKFISGAARGRDVCCGRPLGDRNSFRAPRGGAMLLRSSSWRPKFISVIAWGRDVVAVVLLETEIHFGRRVGGAMLLRSSSWRPKFISVIAWGRDVRCGRPLGDRNSFRSSRGGAMFVAVVLLETEIHFGRRVGGRRFIPAVQEPAPPVLQQPAGQASDARRSGRKRRFCPALMRQNRVVSACRQQSGRSAHCAAAENPP
jgi:hypothetical protein